LRYMCCHVVVFCSFFFFSSRRRHTRWPRDWSSDVCSSDMVETLPRRGYRFVGPVCRLPHTSDADSAETTLRSNLPAPLTAFIGRSEERRVGKECRSRGGPCQ